METTIMGYLGLYRGILGFILLTGQMAGCQEIRSRDVPLVQYLGGHRDLVCGLIMGITRVTTWVIGVINLLTKSP